MWPSPVLGGCHSELNKPVKVPSLTAPQIWFETLYLLSKQRQYWNDEETKLSYVVENTAIRRWTPIKTSGETEFSASILLVVIHSPFTYIYSFFSALLYVQKSKLKEKPYVDFLALWFLFVSGKWEAAERKIEGWEDRKIKERRTR